MTHFNARFHGMAGVMTFVVMTVAAGCGDAFQAGSGADGGRDAGGSGGIVTSSSDGGSTGGAGIGGSTASTGGSGGTGGMSCTAPLADCNDDLETDGCEIDTDVDPDHCGVCDNECDSGSCEAGICNPVCGPGQKLVTTQGDVLCWSFDVSLPNEYLGIGGVHGSQMTTGTAPFTQADSSPCVAESKADMEVACSLGSQVGTVTVQFAAYSYMDSAGTQNPIFYCDTWGFADSDCNGTFEYYRNGVLLLRVQDDNNAATPLEDDPATPYNESTCTNVQVDGHVRIQCLGV